MGRLGSEGPALTQPWLTQGRACRGAAEEEGEAEVGH